MALKFRSHDNDPLMVLIYGEDKTGKSTLAEKYCKNKNLTPVVIDVDNTNFTDCLIVDYNPWECNNDKQVFDQIMSTIREIANDTENGIDTIIFDNVTRQIQLMTPTVEPNGNKFYKFNKRKERFDKMIRCLLKTKLNIIFIGQIDAKITYDENSKSNDQIILLNSIVNEKYLCTKTVRNGKSVINPPIAGNNRYMKVKEELY